MLGGNGSPENRGQWKRRSNVETDSYVIVPAVTQFCNIVPTALQRLGYSPEIGHYAKGECEWCLWRDSLLQSSILLTSISLSPRLDHPEELEAPGPGEDLRQPSDNCRGRPWRINIRRDTADLHTPDKAVHIYGNQR